MVKFKILMLTVLTLLVSFSCLSSEVVDSLYRQKIHKLLKVGQITDHEAQIALVKNQNQSEQDALKKQYRSLASKMKKVKVHQFKNDLIEIQVK